jgi:phosphohistidine swiveling domain-containing protein
MADGVLTADSTRAEVTRVAGGKAANLHHLSRAGFDVPRWAVLGADVLTTFRAASGLDGVVDRELAGLRAEHAEQAAARIEKAFLAAELDRATIDAIEAAYAHVDAKSVAVRSSGAQEDGGRLSFAGQYASFLNVSGVDAVAASVRECWASAYSARALTYRLLHGLPVRSVRMAVILQALVPACSSGVLFTANPVSGRRDEVLISSVYGLGQGLVSGMVDADTITVDRESGRVTHVVVGEKRHRVDPLPGAAGCRSVEVPAGSRGALSLSAGQVALLTRCARRVEASFGAPQDVEWAFDGERLWILQSRPITGIGRCSGEVRVWDSANIVESFGEVTAPLTFSFARHVYHRVYREYCQLLGVPRGRLEEMDEWLANMLGYFDGRVYYNVLNWYKVIRLLPGYAVNRKILETAMGVRSTGEELARRQWPWRRRSRAADVLLRAWTVLRFCWLFVTSGRSTRRFLRGFDAVYERFDAHDYASMPADEVYRHFVAAECGLLARWGRTAVLDQVLCLSYGALHALTDRWLPLAPPWFRWQVVTVDGQVESALPVRRMTELAEAVAADPELASLVRRHTTLDGLRAARGERAAWLRRELDRYLEEFGDRNANELKLEEPDLREDPTTLLCLLRDAVAELDAGERAPASGADAESYLDSRLRGWRRWVYERVRRRVRGALRDRERVRLARTRAFGMARRLLTAIGRDLADIGALRHPRDVFFLRLEELRGVFGGTVAHRELRPLAELRRRQQDEQRRMPGPPPRFTTTGSVYWSAWQPDLPEPASGGSASVLRGTGCSPGVATGEARVVDRPREVGSGVVVAYRTDPGWIGVLGTASALLVERGSPLTHVAVVARELGVPTVVQIPDLTRRVRTGMALTVDGGRGTVTIDREVPDAWSTA